jgi:hypothetical protein
MLPAITSEMADIVRSRAWNASRRQSRKPFSLLRGTEGSNPSLSSGESANFRYLSGTTWAAGVIAVAIAAVAWLVWPATRSPQYPPAPVSLAAENVRPTPSASPKAPPVTPQQQIALWDAVIAGNVAEAIVSIRAGADVNALDNRANIAGPNGQRPRLENVCYVSPVPPAAGLADPL